MPAGNTIPAAHGQSGSPFPDPVPVRVRPALRLDPFRALLVSFHCMSCGNRGHLGPGCHYGFRIGTQLVGNFISVGTD